MTNDIIVLFRRAITKAAATRRHDYVTQEIAPSSWSHHSSFSLFLVEPTLLKHFTFTVKIFVHLFYFPAIRAI